MSSTQLNMRELIDSHYESLYRYAYRLAGNESDASDLTQETFSKALTRLNQLRDPLLAKSWLFRILRNAFLHKVRDERRRNIQPLDSVGELAQELPEELPSVEPGALQNALNELDETFRTPLILFYFEEFSYREIAEQMELPIGTVMSRLARAKGYLREKLFPHDDRTADAEHPATPQTRRATNGM